MVTGLFSAVHGSEFELPNLDPLNFEHVLRIISKMLQKQKEPPKEGGESFDISIVSRGLSSFNDRPLPLSLPITIMFPKNMPVLAGIIRRFLVYTSSTLLWLCLECTGKSCSEDTSGRECL